MSSRVGERTILELKRFTLDISKPAVGVGGSCPSVLSGDIMR